MARPGRRGARPATAGILAGLVAAAAGCATPASPPVGSVEARDGPIIEPAVLQTAPPPPEVHMILDQIQGYERWPNERRATAVFSEGHGGRYLISYYNGLVDRARRDGTLPLSDGAQLVAENRRSLDENEPPFLTVMSKQEGRWYWVELSNSSVVLDDQGMPIAGFGKGATAPCASCHAQQRDNDYVFQPRIASNER